MEKTTEATGVTPYLDEAIDVTLALLMLASAALAVVTYVEQRAQVCDVEVFALQMHSNVLSRLWHTLLCLPF